MCQFLVNMIVIISMFGWLLSVAWLHEPSRREPGSRDATNLLAPTEPGPGCFEYCASLAPYLHACNQTHLARVESGWQQSNIASHDASTRKYRQPNTLNVTGLLSLSIECKPAIAWGFDWASVVSFIQHETLASFIYGCSCWLVAASILGRHSLKLYSLRSFLFVTV
jgi:hypothetical protein